MRLQNEQRIKDQMRSYVMLKSFTDSLSSEALSLMKTFAESHPDEIRRIQEKPYSNLRQCRQFIEAILDKKDLDTCIQSIKFLFENGLLPNGMVEMLRSFVTSVAEK